MAHPTEELARRGYDAFSKGDVDALRQVSADNTIFHEPGRNPVSGDYQGIDQMLGFLAAQHGEPMPQHEDLQVLGSVTVSTQDEQLE
jgi:ketosteroid isomerase-like protein